MEITWLKSRFFFYSNPRDLLPITVHHCATFAIVGLPPKTSLAVMPSSPFLNSFPVLFLLFTIFRVSLFSFQLLNVEFPPNYTPILSSFPALSCNYICSLDPTITCRHLIPKLIFLALASLAADSHFQLFIPEIQQN